MRSTTLIQLTLLAITCTTAAACVGEVGGPRKPASTGSAESGSETACTKVERDVTIRSIADMAALPKTGCYDIYGKLVVQGQAITSLAELHELNSVNELDLDHTAIAAIDTVRPVGIYGKLTVTGNAKLANLKQLSFETAATGILIDGNTALSSLDALGLADPKLEEVGGDIAITGNPALAAIPLTNLTKLTGALTVSGNAGLSTIAIGKLTTTGHIEIADNPKLSSLAGFAATTISGDFAVRNNPLLTSLGTLTALYRVTGSVAIDNNAALVNLAAFTTSLKFIDQTLTITNNPALVDLGSLKHVQLVGAISITNNASLVTCRATEGDKCTQHPTTSVITGNKSASCSSLCT